MARHLVARAHDETLLCLFLLAIVSIDKDANFARIAPLSIVFFSLTFDDCLDLSFLESFSPELFDPFWKFVSVSNRKKRKTEL